LAKRFELIKSGNGLVAHSDREIVNQEGVTDHDFSFVDDLNFDTDY
jgi:hypothetical protein